MPDPQPLPQSAETNREPDNSRCGEQATSADTTGAVLRKLVDTYSELDRMNARLEREMTAHHKTTTRLIEELAAHRETRMQLAQKQGSLLLVDVRSAVRRALRRRARRV